MDNFPSLDTPRLILDQPSVDDIPLIVEYAGNKSVAAFTLNIPHPYVEQDAVYWINMSKQGFRNHSAFIFAIRFKENNKLIGGIGLTIDQRHRRAEAGYWLAEPFWNKGLLTEALQAIITFGFDQLSLHKITAHYLSVNTASGRVMDKAGMKKEGELKSHLLKGDVFHNIVVYGLTRDDFNQQKK